MRKVIVTQDGDGHWYVIPAEMIDSFNRLLADGGKFDDYEDFEENFGKFRTGGDINNVELFANI